MFSFNVFNQMHNIINQNEWPELNEGDPLADAVIADWIKASPEGKNWLLEGMRNGAHSIPQAPASYHALLTQTEAFLRAASLLDLAPMPYLYASPMWISVSMGPGALLHTYTDPNIANILVKSGKLVNEAASRRLSETQLWLLQLLQADAWQIGGTGYVHTLQVRLIHAKVRASMRKKTPHHNVSPPIDQRQMVHTWLGFAIVSPSALERLGIEWTAEEKTHVAALWQIVGKLLGIPSRIMTELAGDGCAEHWLKSFNRAPSYPDENARVLTRSMLEALGQRMSVAMKLPKDIAIALMHGFARHIQGDALADAFGASDASLSALIPTYVDANRYHMQKLRQDESYRQSFMAQSSKQIHAICAQIDGSAAYQQN
jgi:hypothetical protein